jgi:dipeptidyl-peptidase-4
MSLRSSTPADDDDETSAPPPDEYSLLDESKAKKKKPHCRSKACVTMLVVGGLLLVALVGLVSYVASRHFLVPSLVALDALAAWAARGAPALRWLHSSSFVVFNDSAWRFANGTVLLGVGAQPDSIFSPDADFALTPSVVQRVFRHSTRAEFALIDVRAQKRLPFAFAEQVLRNALFDQRSADLAVVDDAFDIHILSPASNWLLPLRVTADGSANVSSGVQNWLYEEEIYGDANAIRFRSPFLAFLRSDESAVPLRTIPLYSSASNDPDHWTEHYSQVGDPLPRVSLRVFDRRSNATVVVQPGAYPYIVSFDFVDDDGAEPTLFVRTLTRKQDALEAFRCAPSTGVCTLAYKQAARVIQWVDVNPILWHAGDAYQLEQLATERVISRRRASALDQPIDMNVSHTPIAIIGFDAAGALWYLCAHPDPASQRVCVRANTTATEQMLAADATQLSFALSAPSSEPLYSSASLSPDGTLAVAQYGGPAVPFTLLVATRNVSQGATLLESNELLRAKVAASVMLEKEFFNVTLSDDFVTSAWIMNANAAKNGIVFNTYGGPDAVFVSHAYSVGINHVLATELDIAVAGADVGGAGLRGVQFLKRCSPLLGNAAARDSNTVMAFLKSKYRAPRIGMHGWSFGGSTSAKSLTLPDAPDFAIAIAPVTDWRLYDAAYTERYTSVDPAMVIFNQTSLLGATCAKIRNDSLLLMHGTDDDNVHYVNTATLAFCLTQAAVRFEMHSFINKNHGISGNGAREAVYTMMVEFVRDQLSK